MKITNLIRYTLMIGVLTAVGAVAVSAQKVDCGSKSNTDLVIEIYNTIKAKYPTAWRNLNITADGGVVKVVGWVAKEKDLGKITKLIKKIKCVKSVENMATAGKTGGCGPGQKECGGACISEKEACNVCLADPAAPGCATGTTDPKKP